MSGERDLDEIFRSLTVARRADTYVYVSASALDSIPAAAATIHEDEGTTFVVDLTSAERLQLAWSFAAAWLTVRVHTSLDAVGVTAALATALAKEGIACNVLAGFYHDHLLVPVERVDDAIAALDLVRQHTGRSTS